MGEQHKHAELIKAWADGAVIQQHWLKDYGEFWYNTDNPNWNDDEYEFRISPFKPKQKVKMWQWIYECGGQYSLDVDFHKSLADAIVALEGGYGFKVIQRADWTEIEVEVGDE